MVNYAGDELPQGIEIRKDGKVMTADEVVAELQEARAQQAGSGEAVYFYRHPASDPNNWREIPKATYDIQREDRFFENHKYRILYTHPSASVPEGWREVFEQVLNRWLHVGAESGLVEDSDSDLFRKAESMLTTTPQPADNWIKCSEQPPTEVFSEADTLIDLLRDAAMDEDKVDTCYDQPNKNPGLATALNWLADLVSTGLKRPTPPAEGAE